MAGSGGVTLERLERYAAARRSKDGAGGEGGLGELVAKSAALAQLNKVVEKRDFGANLLRDLGAADLKLKPSEYIAIWAAPIVGLPVAVLPHRVRRAGVPEPDHAARSACSSASWPRASG